MSRQGRVAMQQREHPWSTRTRDVHGSSHRDTSPSVVVRKRAPGTLQPTRPAFSKLHLRGKETPQRTQIPWKARADASHPVTAAWHVAISLMSSSGTLLSNKDAANNCRVLLQIHQ